MISVIVCTPNEGLSAEQKQNILETAGTELDLVVIDNSANSETIFSAYNKGVSQSNGNILCFVHDDVMFRTPNWGSIIQSHFEKDEKLGLVGFAGAHFMPDMPMYWHDSPFISEYDLTTRNGHTEKCFFTEHFGERNLAEVAAVDGLCFFLRKELFDRISFDEQTFDGFHLYDMDISMQVRECGYKVCVCRDVLVEHFYDFNPSKAGYETFELNLRKFHEKWSSRFPLSVGLEGMTDGMVAQLNRYVRQALQAEKAYQGAVTSKAYRLGKTVLKPLNMLKGKK